VVVKVSEFPCSWWLVLVGDCSGSGSNIKKETREDKETMNEVESYTKPPPPPANQA
jgi:hypothetical protein